MKNIVLFLLFFLGCISTKNLTQKENDIQKIIDFFIEQTNVSNKEIILNLHYTPWEDDLYSVVIVAFDKDMPINKVEKGNIDYGRYKYKGMNISISTSSEIYIEPTKWKNFVKISNSSFSNENNMNINYDPETLKFYVDKNLNYVKQFHNDRIETEVEVQIKNFLKENSDGGQ